MDGFLKDQDQLKKYEKNLVAEQPGILTSIIGLMLSLFIGVAIQVAISSDKIIPLIDKAATNIDPRISARVQSARVSLANGIFPEIAVVVTGIHIESNEACWMRPVLEIDELKLPLNLLKLFQGQFQVKEIIANEASLSLRNEASHCDSKVSKIEKTNETNQNPKVVNNDEFKKHGNFIEHIFVKKFQIHYLPVSFTSVLIKNFNIQVVDNIKKNIDLNGIVQISGETLSGDYNSSAYLNLNYDESGEIPFKGELNGNWREGSYSVGLEYQPISSKYKIDLDMNHIPANQLIPLLKKYKLLSNELNGKQIWVSTRATFNGEMKQFSNSQALFHFFRLEGNIGELELKNIELSKLNPIQHKPFIVEVKSLNFDQLLSFLNRNHPNSSILQLGTFHGQIHFRNENDLSLNGELTGLEIAFSNRGIRQAQGVSYVHGNLKLLNKKWKMEIDKIKPIEGVFLGSVELEADRNWDQVMIKSHIDDLTLGQAVQKVVTDGGELGTLSGDIGIKLSKNVVQDLKGKLSTPHLLIDQVLYRNSKLIFYSKEEQVFADLKIQAAKIFPQSQLFKYLSEMQKDFVDEKNLDANNITLKAKKNSSKGVSWDDGSFSINQNKFHFYGKWDDNGILEGKWDVFSKKGKTTFELAGHREYPRFVKK